MIGPCVEGTLFEETTDSRQQIRIFAQFAKAALINNPKFPVAEQKIVQELLPDPSIFFQDPDKARSDLNELKDSLEGFQTAKGKELAGKKITAKRRGELIDQISRIGEILSMMESPEETEEEFEVGKIYTDSQGNRAKFLGDGQWEELQ